MFFGGKGGVGKTTLAASRALFEAAAGRQVLVISTDPAHSLGDALAMKLSATPRRVAARLDAVELDAPRAFSRWLSEHRRPLGQILERGTLLDREDVDALLDLSIPGVDELVGLMEIARLATPPLRALRPLRSNHHDVVVVDTAPTGHTLRLLAAPETVTVVASVLDALQEEHRVIRDQLARVGRGPDAADRLIAALAEQARETAARLRSAATSFYWVTLPEALSIAESDDALRALDAAGVAVEEIVVNRVLPEEPRCPVCDRRRVEERRALAVVRRGIGRGRQLRVVAAEIVEPRGIKALTRIGTKLSTTVDAVDTDVKSRKMSSSASSVSSVAESSSKAVTPEALVAIRGASLIFFGGKGGVGKTTVAAATALRLARADRRKRVLLLSTDPAHSLADVLQTPAGDVASRVPRGPVNLAVRELDAPAALEGKRADLETAFDEIAGSFGAGEIGGGASRAKELVRLAPPGIDELFGILSVFEARSQYDIIVIDTAPTGHALRLLEMPDAAREWAQALMRVLMKYRALAHPGQLGVELVDLAKSVRQLQAVLRDASQTRFVIVTRAADVPRFETQRLAARLRRLKLSVPAIIVNAMTLAPGTCRRCRATAKAERRVMAALPRTWTIIQTPLSAPPPRGVAALENWGRQWVRST